MEVYYQNSSGDKLSLTSGSVRLISIGGASITNNINISGSNSIDGGIFLSAHAPERHLLLLLKCSGDIEAARAEIYKAFRTKSPGELFFMTSKKAYKITCYVEKIDVTLNAGKNRVQVALTCPDPYFSSVTRKRISMQGINGMWEFPWEIPTSSEKPSGFELAVQSTDRIARITNSGEVETGCIFELKARAYVKNPRLQNINTFEWIQLNTEMQAEDIIIINTIKGQKSISMIRNGVTTNIINYKVWGSTFLQLSCGLNEIVCDAEEGLTSLSIMCYMSERFGGV